MLSITFEVNGRKVSPENIADAFEAAILESFELQIRSKLDGIRDPETGEFPVVRFSGRDLDNLSAQVSGSEKLIALVRSRLGETSDRGGGDVSEENAQSRVPQAFLCHSSKDKELAHRLANDLQAQGIDTFFDAWEIGPGDSLRQKIDAGLTNCTHFIALLTPNSIDAPWVKAEMDAAFIRKVSGKSKFIPLRSELPVELLPPLLQALHSPELTAYEADVKALVHSIHGVTRKPALGPAPRPVREQNVGATGLSPAAELIAKLMIDRSEHGNSFDPQLDGNELRSLASLPDDDLIDAVDELEGRGFVRKHVTMGCGSLGFAFVIPEAALYSELDQHFMAWNPEHDALRIAAELVNEGYDGGVPKLAEKLDWLPRRMNPAVNYLIARDLIDSSEACGTHPWCTHWVRKTQKTRRFLKDRS